jgi:hypothetical protein
MKCSKDFVRVFVEQHMTNYAVATVQANFAGFPSEQDNMSD